MLVTVVLTSLVNVCDDGCLCELEVETACVVNFIEDVVKFVIKTGPGQKGKRQLICNS